MFANVIPLIVALLIFTTYQPPEAPFFDLPVTLAALGLALVLYHLATRLRLARLARLAGRIHSFSFDERLDRIQTQQTIVALLFFALEIYGLNLPLLLSGAPPFERFPTLLALLFLLLFLLHLVLLWIAAYPLQFRGHDQGPGRGELVRSQLAAALPVLLPWVLISGAGDLLRALPFETPRRLLATPAGEAVYFLFFLLLVAIVGPALIQKSWRCHPLAPGFYRQRIAALCQRAGLAYREILVWPIFGGRMITAGIMGLVRRFRYLLVTEALLRHLDPLEVDAVVAHEIGHVKRRHLLFYLFFFAGYLLIATAAMDLLLYLLVASPLLWRFSLATGLSHGSVISAIFSLAIIAAFLIYFRYIFGYFMRHFERQADLYVFTLFPSARPLISTLEKIARASGQSPERPNWHHFSIAERIAYLERSEADRSWIGHHDRRLRRAMGLYLAGMLLCAALGYHLNTGAWSRRLNSDLLAQIIERQMTQDPDNPQLLTALADIHHQRQRYADALQAYERALSLAPGDPHALNNLAWLLVTSPAQVPRDPPRALALARQAVALAPEPHALDTLAECLWANGQAEEALAVARRALESATTMQAYYRAQVERFQREKEKGGRDKGGTEKGET